MKNTSNVTLVLICILFFLSACTAQTDQSIPAATRDSEPEERSSPTETPVEQTSPPDPGPAMTDPPTEQAAPTTQPESQDDSEGPLPIPDSQSPSRTTNILEQLGSSPIGGGGGNGCHELLPIRSEKEILFRYDGLGEVWQICILNYPQGTANITLSTGSGAFEEQFSVEPFLGAYDIGIQLPAIITRDGPLEVTFEIDGITASESFDIQDFEQVKVYESPASASMYGGQGPDTRYAPGEQIDLLGVNLQPSTEVILGIYRLSEYDFQNYVFLVEQFSVFTNETGEFFTAIPFDAKYGFGSYVIYFGYDGDDFNIAEVNGRSDFQTFSISSSPAWQPCEADYASGLRVGDVGFVGDEPPLANRVRSAPTTNSEVIGEIQPLETFIILDGPICDGGWVWWYVQGPMDYETVAPLYEGWTSEGDVNGTWLFRASD